MADEKASIYAQARALARNPLGLIALFILLVYAMATTVLGLKADVLQADERKILLYFLVGFPCLVLAAFYLLVSRHHGKLYAPYDYKTDETFLQTLGPERQRERLEQEVREDAAPAQVSAEALAGPDNLSRSKEVARPPRVKYLLAEELAIRALEAELGRSAQRQVAVIAKGDVPVREYDAVFMGPPDTVAVDVKLLTGRSARRDVIDVALQKALFLTRLPGQPAKMILVIVTDTDPTIGQWIREYFNQVAANVEARNLELRIFELSELQRRFGAENAG